MCGGGGNKSKNKYTQAQVNSMNNKLIGQARKKWTNAVRGWNRSTNQKAINRQLNPYISNLQNITGDWTDTTLTDIDRMRGMAESNRDTLAAAMGETFDSSGRPDKDDYGAISLYDRKTGTRSHNTNIFAGQGARGAWDHRAGLNWAGPKLNEAPDIASIVKPYHSTASSNWDTLNDWYGKREAEVGLYDTFREGLRSDLQQGWSDASGLGIQDGDEITQGLADFQLLKDRRADFSTKLKDFADFSQSDRYLGVGDERGRLGAKLDKLKAGRATEIARINKAESDFQTRYDTAKSTFGNYDITDEAGMNTMEDTLRKLGREVNRFNTVITDEWDAGDYTGDIDDLDLSLDNLQRKRADELYRIKGDTSRLKRESGVLGSSLRRMGTESLSDIKDLEDLINDSQKEVTGYSSLLDFSGISGLAGDFTGYDADIASLIAKRKTELDAFESDAAKYGTELTGTDLWEERKMNDIMTRLGRQEAKLSGYEGGRVPGLLADYESGADDITKKLGDLEDKRDDFESLANTYLSKARGGFFNMADLGTMKTNYDTLSANVTKYDAGQASDELTSLSAAIRNEEARFAAEQAAKKKQEEEELARMNQGGGFMYGLGGRALTPGEYARLLSRRRDDETPTTRGLLASLYG